MSIFSIGLSGLYSAQIALNTTSNNISNVYTPGYNREVTLLSEKRPGAGSQVSAVQRQFDDFVAAQLNSATNMSKALESYESQISQIDNLLGDLDAGLSRLLENFFESLQQLAASPSDPAARQGVIGTAESLTAQMRSFDAYLADMQEGVASQLDDHVVQINNLGERIADLNREIVVARAKLGEAPNSLLNQRDKLVADLSELVDVDKHEQGASYYISIGNGRPLVAGDRSYQLTTMTSAADPTRATIGYIDSAGNEVELPERTFQAGRVGGLLQFRRESLDIVQNKLGQMGASLALAFNEQHEAGVDLDGDAGKSFFAISDPLVFGSDGNVGTASIAAAYGDYRQLTGRDYELKFDAAADEFVVTPLSGGESRRIAVDMGTGEFELDGLALSVDDPATLVDGDRFQVQPTRRAAAGMDTLISDTVELAAGEEAATGDNRNALALQALQDTAIVGGHATLSQAYASIVSDVGNRSNVVSVNLKAQESLTEQLRTVQQSHSGVNLDEEAANLIRYTQFYQANARVIDTGTTILDTILGLRS